MKQKEIAVSAIVLANASLPTFAASQAVTFASVVFEHIASQAVTFASMVFEHFELPRIFVLNTFANTNVQNKLYRVMNTKFALRIFLVKQWRRSHLNIEMIAWLFEMCKKKSFFKSPVQTMRLAFNSLR